MMFVSAAICLMLAVQAVSAGTSMLRSNTSRRLAPKGATKVTYQYKGKTAYGLAQVRGSYGLCVTETDVGILMSEQVIKLKAGTGKPDKTFTNGITITVFNYDVCNEGNNWYKSGQSNFGGFDKGNFRKASVEITVDTALCDQNGEQCKDFKLEANITPVGKWSKPTKNQVVTSEEGLQMVQTYFGRNADADFEVTNLSIGDVIFSLDDVNPSGWFSETKYGETNITWWRV